MVKVEVSVMIDRPVEEVGKFMSDLSNVPKWDTSVSEVRQTSAGSLEVGSTCYYKEKMMNTTVLMRVTEYEPNRRLSFEHTSGPVKGSILTYRLETIEGKTRVTRTDDLKLSGFNKLLGPLVVRRMKRGIAAGFGNLKRMLESQAQS
jgi:uncharacterized protein YndB with AHSA1/START domain